MPGIARGPHLPRGTGESASGWTAGRTLPGSNTPPGWRELDPPELAQATPSIVVLRQSVAVTS